MPGPISLSPMPGPQRMRQGPSLPYDELAAVIPCRRGWAVAVGKLIGIQVFPDEPTVVARFRDVIDNIPAYKIIAVTLPVGLPTEPHRGGRMADEAARHVLGFPHAGAIGSTPTRRALTQRGYEAARTANGGLLDVVTWQQFRRIRELDEEMEPYLQRRVFEVRPELSFYQLNEDVPMQHPKDSAAGRKEREALLRQRMPGAQRILDADVAGVPRYQLADLAVTLWTARRIAARAITRVPEDPEWDDKGLRMEIVR